MAGGTLVLHCWGMTGAGEVRLVVGFVNESTQGPGFVLVPKPEIIWQPKLTTHDDDGPNGSSELNLPPYSFLDVTLTLPDPLPTQPKFWVQALGTWAGKWRASNGVEGTFQN